MRLMKMRLILFVAILAAGLAKLQAGPLEADVHLTFPLTKQKLLGIYVDARLYEYDPWLADAPATLVDQVEFKGLDLSTKAHSLLDLHFSARRKTRMNYYVSIRAMPKRAARSIILSMVSRKSSRAWTRMNWTSSWPRAWLKRIQPMIQ